MIFPEAAEISKRQYAQIEEWHKNEPEFDTLPSADELHTNINSNNMCNYKLWHEEDFARREDVSDSEIARVKRAIDRWNQQRNDYIEKIDMVFIREIQKHDGSSQTGATQNSETVGSIIDRLSILNLKIFHMRELVAFYPEKQKFSDKLDVLLRQEKDLSGALNSLVDEIGSGNRFIRIYRQMKMYNDPETNPQLNREMQKKS